jgi:hypothetical protein
MRKNGYWVFHLHDNRNSRIRQFSFELTDLILIFYQFSGLFEIEAVNPMASRYEMDELCPTIPLGMIFY